MIYLATFGISAILLYIAGKQKSKTLRFALYSLGLIGPCLLAAFRSEEIGTDIHSYVIYQFDHAIKASFFDFMTYAAGTTEPGWNLMTWFICHFSHSLPLYLFTIELLCMLPVFILLNKLYRGSEWSGMISWYLLFYSFSLNGMRQSIAMSIVLLSYLFVRHKNPIAFCATVVLACLFHQTALIGFFVYPLFTVAESQPPRYERSFVPNRPLLIVILSSLSLLLVVFGEALFTPFTSFKDSYNYQLEHMGASDINWSALFLLFSVCLVVVLSYIREGFFKNRGRNVDNLREFGFLAILSIFGCLLRELDIVSNTLGRLGLYYLMFACVMSASLICSSKRNQSIAMLFYILQACYFIVCTMTLGQSEIYPYQSSLGGWLF